jgi:hypothetical protein
VLKLKRVLEISIVIALSRPRFLIWLERNGALQQKERGLGRAAAGTRRTKATRQRNFCYWYWKTS